MPAAKVVNLKKIKKEESPDDAKIADTAISADKDKIPTISSDTPLIAWTSRDHVPPERTILWYAVILAAGAALLFWALWTFNFLFAFFIVAALIALFAVASQPPKHDRIEIFPTGIAIEGMPQIGFSEIESFWLFSEVNPPLLFLKPRRHIKFPTYLLLENVGPEEVREVLLNYIPEREEEFPFSERLSRWMGF